MRKCRETKLMSYQPLTQNTACLYFLYGATQMHNINLIMERENGN